MDEILICHTGTDTWFTMDDTGYIISRPDAEAHDTEGSLSDANSLDEIAMQHGYQITPELAVLIYEMVMNYHEGRE
jgi:hypothetical protein